MLKLLDRGRAPFTTRPSPLIPAFNPGNTPGSNVGSESRIERPNDVAITGNDSTSLVAMEYFMVALLASIPEGVAFTSITSFTPLGCRVNAIAEFIPPCSVSELTLIVANPDVSISSVYAPGGRKGM